MDNIVVCDVHIISALSCTIIHKYAQICTNDAMA